jgi:Flp pilus assembly protein TadD
MIQCKAVAVLVRVVWLGCALAGCASATPLPPRAVELNAAGAQAIADGHLSEAEASLAVALEYNPRFVEAWVNLGYVELRRGRFERARRDFLKARDLNQDIPAPHHALGVLADEEGRGADAEAHYRAALKIDPGFYPARANLARRLFARGRFEDAREQFERLRQVVPEAVEGWVGEAEALRHLGRAGESEALVALARERFGDVPELRMLWARERLERGEPEEAEAILAPLTGGADRALAGAAWSWIAVARVARGDEVGAGEAARAALTIDREDAVARHAEGLLSDARSSGKIRSDPNKTSTRLRRDTGPPLVPP